MRLGATMPNFKAETTKGKIRFFEWQGDSWVILFSHPSDFTPVCTTELARMAVRLPEFTKRNAKCLAHSVDDIETHNKWVKDIQSYCKEIPEEFPYPVIADPRRDLAVLFGMLDEDQKRDPVIAQTIRALYIISPDHKVRLSMFYPIATGRNVDEILRSLDSLQLTYKLKVVVTPVDWTPGNKVMIQPEVTDDEANKLFPKGFEKVPLPSGLDYVRTTEDY
ncbi:PREDICTED: peroxiredoxin-6-like [Bactrocera latifrons]|uniref:1-Cys peroxiredoxin n=3 Tax=Bactrocera latifrons TaxID=174628 RepID=A0A0K8U3U5_BACLA|nr:PREDICTED: peroxiredoxin-6-like [Bactrocera latifrons]XP_039949097.1 peroxiredoxin-6-like [Bactrocera tryoni]XP_050335863.1 peroxiredoxin-6-like [Bactrocera neohumeralis]